MSSHCGRAAKQDLGDAFAGLTLRDTHVPAAVADARPPHLDSSWLISKISLLLKLARSEKSEQRYLLIVGVANFVEYMSVCKSIINIMMINLYVRCYSTVSKHGQT